MDRRPTSPLLNPSLHIQRPPTPKQNTESAALALGGGLLATTAATGSSSQRALAVPASEAPDLSPILLTYEGKPRRFGDIIGKKVRGSVVGLWDCGGKKERVGRVNRSNRGDGIGRATDATSVAGQSRPTSARTHTQGTLLVNVASYCALTPQYPALEDLYEKYKDQGFEIVGVGCNQFGGQEPEKMEKVRLCAGVWVYGFGGLKVGEVCVWVWWIG